MKKNTLEPISQKMCNRLMKYVRTLEHTNIWDISKALHYNGSDFEPVFKVDYKPDCCAMPKYFDMYDIAFFMRDYPEGISIEDYLRELVQMMEI